MNFKDFQNGNFEKQDVGLNDILNDINEAQESTPTTNHIEQPQEETSFEPEYNFDYNQQAYNNASDFNEPQPQQAASPLAGFSGELIVGIGDTVISTVLAGMATKFLKTKVTKSQVSLKADQKKLLEPLVDATLKEQKFEFKSAGEALFWTAAICFGSNVLGIYLAKKAEEPEEEEETNDLNEIANRSKPKGRRGRPRKE